MSQGTRRLAADRAGCGQGFARICYSPAATVLHAACVHRPSFTSHFCRPIRNLSEQSLSISVSLAVSRLAVARGASLQQSPYYCCIPARGALLLPLLACYCCYSAQASQVRPSQAVCWPGQDAQGEPHARTARAWTKGHDKTGVCSYTAFCVTPPHHRPAQGACSVISPANDSWRSVNRIWLDRMDGGMWISEVCGTAICRDTPPHHTPRYIHMYVIMMGVAVTWPHAVGTLSRCWSGWWQQKENATSPTFFPLYLNHVRHRQCS